MSSARLEKDDGASLQEQHPSWNQAQPLARNITPHRHTKWNAPSVQFKQMEVHLPSLLSSPLLLVALIASEERPRLHRQHTFFRNRFLSYQCILESEPF
jgi:hypothetical protein